MDKRLKEINLLLSEYAFGRFDRRLSESNRLDEIDAVINGINMLGEELTAITISRDYFTGIFNSVSDMVFVLNSRGIIEEANRSAEQQLGYGSGVLKGMLFSHLHQRGHSFYGSIRKMLREKESVQVNEDFLKRRNETRMPVRINASRFHDQRRRKLVLLTASDTSFQVEAEKMVIRAIIHTQEKERERLAKDLHDSLTQQLSAIKFYVSSITPGIRTKFERDVLLKSNEALTLLIADMRNICFNLMPRTLEAFGLVKAVQEFCNQLLFRMDVEVSIKQGQALPSFTPELSIDLYRVIQEMVGNAIRHGKAKHIGIEFNYRRKTLIIKVCDDGEGFDSGRAAKGMGLQNIQSRVRSHNGRFDVQSTRKNGTTCTLYIPLNN